MPFPPARLFFVASLLLAIAGCGDDGPAHGPDGGAEIADASPSPDAAVVPTSWVTTLGGPGSDRVDDVAIDNAGHVALVGSHQGELVLGGEPLVAGAVVARYAPDGRLSWAKALGEGARAEAIATDAEGNLYVAGSFEGTVDFGDGPIEADSIDGFLVSYFPDGSARWSVTFGGPGFDGAFDVGVGGGTVAITGEFQAFVDFGADELTSEALLRDGFLAIYSTAGEPAWAIGIGGEDDGDHGAAVAVGRDGSIAVTGLCNGNVNFGELAQSTDVSPDEFDLFVVVYDAGGGMPISFRRFGAAPIVPLGIALGPDGGALVAGWFGGTASFGDHELSSEGSRDGFVVAFDPAGDPSWARQLGGVSIDEAAAVAVAGADLLVTGHVANEVDLGAGPDGRESNVSDLFWARYQRSDGAHVDSQRLRPDDLLDGMEGSAVAVGPAGQVVLAGKVEGSATVDGARITSAGESDGLILQRLP